MGMGGYDVMSELRSYVKVKVDVLGSLSLVVHVFSVCIKQTKEEEEEENM